MSNCTGRQYEGSGRWPRASRIVVIGFVSVALLLQGGRALASDESKRLVARGLVAFNADRYAEALELFDRAIATNPANVNALYYRAATQARLENYEAVIEDLKKVVALRPDFPQAPLDLGVALVEIARYEEAVPWLEQAKLHPESEARASMFLGLAMLRLGRTGEAKENFLLASGDPTQTVAARYYLGVTAYQEHEWLEAEEHFAFVADTSPSSAVGREAGEFLKKLGVRGRRRYQAYGGTGFQYDSNVILAPADAAGAAQDVLGVSQKADGRTVLNVGGNYVPWRNRQARLSIGYDFFQSLHFKLNEFNLQDHGPSIQLSGRAGPVQLALLGRYDYYLLKTDSFLQQVTAWPWVTVPEGDVGRADLYYRMRWRDYKIRSYAVLDGYNHAVGFEQVFYLGRADRRASIGYEFALQDPDVDDGVFTKDEAESYGFLGNTVGAGLGSALPLQMDAELRYRYSHLRYRDESKDFTPSGDRRSDNEHYVAVAVTRPFLSWLNVTAAFLADIADSNDPRFEYDRYIGSLTVEISY